MKNDLIILLGRSGSGKTTVLKKLGNELVSYTTRAKRDGEIEGIDYYFVDELPADTIASFIINDKWKYGVSLTHINQKNYIAVISPSYALSIGLAARKAGLNVIFVHIDISREERHQRLQLRGEVNIEKRFEIEDSEGEINEKCVRITGDKKTSDEIAEEIRRLT